MKSMPLLPQQLHEPTEIREAADLLEWARDLVNWLQAANYPPWWKSEGALQDLEGAATLSVANQRLALAASNLLKRENAGTCQDPAPYEV